MGLTIATQMIIGNIIEPGLIGDGVGLHPVTVIVCLVFWSIVWGLAGAFLAVPLTVALKMVLEQFEPTNPLAKMMEGRLF
jgi:AI-2 transport protein TqsA